ncbi:MAG: DNA polymerase III subunit beta [Ignavibacteria bacterium RIFOXYB2_FULL_35_12]|nr:MAG: DNA polymerase III subunit beta [Ignavibacteria bacterium GWA2_36_19]OGU62542.1 MAG: DNA polymerase III subunit beta [Ignavibacteria bacterium GWF2_35_20]OGU81772.1 MAG: DNA polymerase III subunit beta [Ignavibacteria bacterium RIFOXYA2_FULL_35_9]OGU87600.1 MAG: DNA polymerase III subunit beta [Ignavibacteria bacterium RIFOXYA12_FULL_35_25]OGU88031.1 MAG: DNA polymerase III subunit beta [Ignavibacteria bacterium RIFOXYC12_FULL_35_11]OGU96171.1 MAG: DNA polymerase III subunit beta [Igna
MEFKVNSKVLEKLLSKIIPAVPSRTPMPILENFLFEIKDGSLVVSATDLEISLKASMNVAAESNIKMVVPARLLYDVVRNLDETQIHFENSPNLKLKLKTDFGTYNIGYSSHDDFPAIPSVSRDKEIVISGNDLKRAIDQTSFAMSKEDMRPAMTGTLFEFSTDGLRFVTTDGHRLVKYVFKNIIAEKNEQYIIPERAISVLSKLLSESDVKIYLSKTHISFQMGELEFITRLIGEKYPAYGSVIPLENENILKIKTLELLSSVKRMLLFSSSNSKQVKFTLKKDNLEVSAEDIDRGSNAVENILCDYKGESMEIGFNTAYVNDVLSHVYNEEVIFKLHSPTKACIVEPSKIKDTEELLLLLMPVRLNN